MKVIYLLLIFGFISGSTVPERVFDLWYNYEYTLTQDLITYDYQYYAFRIPVNYEGKMDFEVKIPQDQYQDFTICVHDWYNVPKIADIIYYHGTSKEVSGTSNYKEGEYWVYSYAFDATEGATYFSIEMEVPNRQAFSYMVVRVNSSKYHYSNIKDLTFNENYEIDTSIFTATQNRIPFRYQIFIRIGVFDDDEMEIQLTTHRAYDKNSAFKVDVCQYVDKPTQEQVYYGNNAARTNTSLENTSEEEGKYYYPFTTDKGIRYLSISIINNLDNLDYLYIFIYSKTGMAVAIIIVIVVAVVAVVGLGVYFILKKLGICK